MCFYVQLRMMVMTWDQGWFVPATIFVMLSGLGMEMRVDGRLLSITAEGWWKQENQIISWDVKWDVLLVGWSTFCAPPTHFPSAIRLIITVHLYHMWLFGLLLSSITEETIWGNNGPCSFPRQSILCYFSRSFSVILHFGDKNSNFYNTFIIWFTAVNVLKWNVCTLTANNLLTNEWFAHIKETLQKDLVEG